MKKFFLLSAIALPIGLFAQGPNNNPPQQVQQIQTINYINQTIENNNPDESFANKINNDKNPLQINILNSQQANPPAQVQQQQSSGSFFGSDENETNKVKTTGCKDCDAVKKALAASHASSGGHHGKSFNLQQWSKTISGKIYMKTRKTFARHKKIKTSYEICFHWA